jgi:hypothetical protein
MSNIAIWNGTSQFTTGSTPFGFYDSDPEFQAEADKVANFCATRLGYPLMDVELQDISFYACFEEAVSTYASEIYQYKIRENYLNLEGSSTTTPLNDRVITPSLSTIIEVSKNYGTEAEVGGYLTKYTGSIDLKAGQQVYDLNAWAVSKGITGSIEVRKVFYNAPPAIMRYFDPYAGTGTGIQSLMDAFDFGSYSPGINFLLMPTSFDVLKIQAIEFNDQIRRSVYSFELVNNQLRIFPVPRIDGSMIFEYYLMSDKRAQNTVLNVSNSVSNASNVPFDNITYGTVNQPGKQWIYRYTLALARELLAYIRGKYTTVPVPGSEATLNQSDLLADARSEKELLVEQLRDMLEAVTRREQLKKQSEEAEYLQKTLLQVPYKIYVG